MNPADFPELAPLLAAIEGCLCRQRPRFHQKLQQLAHRRAQNKPIDRDLDFLTRQVLDAQTTVMNRLQALPIPTFDEQLPIAAHRERIADAIRENQVVVVCGETGSGKTTQLPKICLSLGLGAAGLIGHTQPRRLAARSVAARIAQELHSDLGQLVGYQVRFNERLSANTCVKLMTDGILLAETQHDPQLLQYQTIIIDEAHERSLNIDFLLGYLHRLLPQRPDLKLIITSATLDPLRFSRHFHDAPIITVEGRSFPVEVRYRPLSARDRTDDDARDMDLPEFIADTAAELAREGPGDMLVFLPGEREIRAAERAIHQRQIPHTTVLPLYARLAFEQQNQVFSSHTGRRIVLATNVAETSLTVPGIRFVIDTGLVRLSRYNPRTKVQRLPIETISVASANQRAGRCGRVGPGICVRLYDAADLLTMSEFTDPEIVRTNLAAVILQMTALHLGSAEDFPFVDPPENRLIQDGYQLLFELQAVDERRELTELGRQLAKLAIDPRLGRMIVAAHPQGALTEVLVMASALAIQDPRERPLDVAKLADEKHRRFLDPKSDFLAFWNLWRDYQEQRASRTQNQLRAYCREQFLSFVRMGEWHDLHQQLAEQTRELGFTANDQPADYGAIHRALLTGLLGQVGQRREQDQTYEGARNQRFTLFPGSGLAKKPPKWVMATELVETSKRFGRTCAAIEPDWLEVLAPHLVKRSYQDPHYVARQGQVIAKERVTLYGLPVVMDRDMAYAKIDPTLCRELFIRHALVRFEYKTEAAFFRHNQQLVDEIADLENRARRRDLLVDETAIFAFFDRQLPPTVVNASSFEKWWRQQEKETPHALHLTPKDLLNREIAEDLPDQFPTHLPMGTLQLPLEYHYAPNDPRDGVTVVVPLAALNQLDEHVIEWGIPGTRLAYLTALIKSLPKNLRRAFVPVPDFATALLDSLPPTGDLKAAVSAKLHRMTGVKIPREAWNLAAVPDHLRLQIRLVDDEGQVVAEGRDLTALRQPLAAQARQAFVAATEGATAAVSATTAASARGPGRGGKSPSTTAPIAAAPSSSGPLVYQEWPAEPLPVSVPLLRAGVMLTAYPTFALYPDRGAATGFVRRDGDDAALAQQSLQQVLSWVIRRKLRHDITRQVPDFPKLALQFMSVAPKDVLADDLNNLLIRQAFLGDDLPRDRVSVDACIALGQKRLPTVLREVVPLVQTILSEQFQIRSRLKTLRQTAVATELAVQLDQLIYAGFLAQTPYRWLAQFPRYLKAIQVRLDKLNYAADKDRARSADCERFWLQYQQQLQRLNGRAVSAELREFRWLIEEFRVSQFAQDLKTVQPVSLKRLEQLWTQLTQ